MGPLLAVDGYEAYILSTHLHHTHTHLSPLVLGTFRKVGDSHDRLCAHHRLYASSVPPPIGSVRVFVYIIIQILI